MSPKLFDTHCHLNFKRLLPQADTVINQARRAGVQWLMIPGTDLATSETAIHLAQSDPDIWAAVGIHPHQVFDLLKSRPSVKSAWTNTSINRLNITTIA